MNEKKAVIHWFRKGLRIHDNPALTKACEVVNSNCKEYILRPVFVLDTELIKWMNVGPNRFRFLQESLVQLHEKLKSINSRLYVIRGDPIKVFPRIFTDWKVFLLTFEYDIEPYAKKRDALVEDMAKEAGVQVIQEVSHTIYDPREVLKRNGGNSIIKYSKFLSIVETMAEPEPLPDPPLLLSEPTPSEDENSQSYAVPELEEIVSDLSALGPNKYPGGEMEALKRMELYLKQTDWICKFEKPKTSPNSLEPSTTVLSPYLKFGCLSSRLFFKKLKKILRDHPKHSKPPVSLVGQLMWREFYYCAAAGEPNFDRMAGNSICYQIPWTKNDDHLKAWAQGRTGYPFIDAIMRQLRQEGWIHHLARHAVACFLTRGDLWISWEEGQKVFEELLLDADWALNAGNWMWLSASAFFYQYFRVYSPVAFGKKTDPEGNYIRKYVPELKNYPAGTIYEPWKVSTANQVKYGCVVGKDYPHRIVVHEIVSKENMSRMAAAYKSNKSSDTDFQVKASSSNATGKRKMDQGTSLMNSKKFCSKASSSVNKK